MPKLFQYLQLEKRSLWQTYLNNYCVLEPPLPLSEFEKIIVVMIFKPIFTLEILRQSVSNMLCLKSLSVLRVNFQDFISKTELVEPILIFSSSDLDPVSYLKNIAKKRNLNIREISIGLNKLDTHIDLIKEAALNGYWICLKNVALQPYFPKNVKCLLKDVQINKSFRLWIIESYNNKILPSSFDCYKKLILELPISLKQKVLYYMNHYLNIFESTNYRHVKVFVSSIILHAVLLENRLFIPQGK